jgi:carbonic anhydrase
MKQKLSTQAQNVLDRLKAGHENWLCSRDQRHSRSFEHAQAVKEAQDPFAVVVTCSDSRMSPELLFGCGFSQLFCIRTAGALVSRYDLASIEFAVKSFDIPLVLVMGHTGCGAVSAACSSDHPGTPHLEHLVSSISQSVSCDDHVDEVSAALADAVASQIMASSTLIRQQDVNVLSCLYDMNSGRITYRL